MSWDHRPTMDAIMEAYKAMPQPMENIVFVGTKRIRDALDEESRPTWELPGDLENAVSAIGLGPATLFGVIPLEFYDSVEEMNAAAERHRQNGKTVHTEDEYLKSAEGKPEIDV